MIDVRLGGDEAGSPDRQAPANSEPKGETNYADRIAYPNQNSRTGISKIILDEVDPIEISHRDANKVCPRTKSRMLDPPGPAIFEEQLFNGQPVTERPGAIVIDHKTVWDPSGTGKALARILVAPGDVVAVRYEQ